MKKVFLDTNILIDFVENRSDAPFVRAIFLRSFHGEFAVCASFLTFANMAYVLHSLYKRSKEEIYDALETMAGQVDVLPMDRHQLQSAITDRARDFEDMLQYQCAVANQCDVIVTRNIKDFRVFSTLPLFSPAAFIDEMTR